MWRALFALLGMVVGQCSADENVDAHWYEAAGGRAFLPTTLNCLLADPNRGGLLPPDDLAEADAPLTSPLAILDLDPPASRELLMIGHRLRGTPLRKRVRNDVMRSSDGGVTWACPANWAASPTAVGAQAFVVRRGGSTAACLAGGRYMEARFASNVSASSLDPTVIRRFTGVSNRVVCTTDGGETWNDAAPLPFNATGMSHASIPSRDVLAHIVLANSNSTSGSSSPGYDEMLRELRRQAAAGEDVHLLLGGWRVSDGEASATDALLLILPAVHADDHDEAGLQGSPSSSLPVRYYRIPLVRDGSGFSELLNPRAKALVTWMARTGRLFIGGGVFRLGDAVAQRDMLTSHQVEVSLELGSGGLVGDANYPTDDAFIVDVLPAIAWALQDTANANISGSTASSEALDKMPLIRTPVPATYASRLRLPKTMPDDERNNRDTDATAYSITSVPLLDYAAAAERFGLSTAGAVPGDRWDAMVFVSGESVFIGGYRQPLPVGEEGSFGVVVPWLSLNGRHYLYRSSFKDHARFQYPYLPTRMLPVPFRRGGAPSRLLGRDGRRPMGNDSVVSYDSNFPVDAPSGSVEGDIIFLASLRTSSASPEQLYFVSFVGCQQPAECGGASSNNKNVSANVTSYVDRCASSPYDARCSVCSTCTQGAEFLAAACAAKTPYSDTLCVACQPCPVGYRRLLPCPLPGLPADASNEEKGRQVCVPHGREPLLTQAQYSALPIAIGGEAAAAIVSVLLMALAETFVTASGRNQAKGWEERTRSSHGSARAAINRNIMPIAGIAGWIVSCTLLLLIAASLLERRGLAVSVRRTGSAAVVDVPALRPDEMGAAAVVLAAMGWVPLLNATLLLCALAGKRGWSVWQALRSSEQIDRRASLPHRTAALLLHLVLLLLSLWRPSLLLERFGRLASRHLGHGSKSKPTDAASKSPPAADDAFDRQADPPDDEHLPSSGDPDLSALLASLRNLALLSVVLLDLPLLAVSTAFLLFCRDTVPTAGLHPSVVDNTFLISGGTAAAVVAMLLQIVALGHDLFTIVSWAPIRQRVLASGGMTALPPPAADISSGTVQYDGIAYHSSQQAPAVVQQQAASKTTAVVRRVNPIEASARAPSSSAAVATHLVSAVQRSGAAAIPPATVTFAAPTAGNVSSSSVDDCAAGSAVHRHMPAAAAARATTATAPIAAVAVHKTGQMAPPSAPAAGGALGGSSNRSSPSVAAPSASFVPGSSSLPAALLEMFARCPTAEGRRLASLRPLFYRNSHLVPGALWAVQQTPLPPDWVRLLSQVEARLNAGVSVDKIVIPQHTALTDPAAGGIYAAPQLPHFAAPHNGQRTASGSSYFDDDDDDDEDESRWHVSDEDGGNSPGDMGCLSSSSSSSSSSSNEEATYLAPQCRARVDSAGDNDISGFE